MARSNRREAGRRRLAMRLPYMRKLIMAARDPWLLELFEAYQMAVEARDSVRRRRFNPKLVLEHDETCLVIERHVIRAIEEDSYAHPLTSDEPSYPGG